MSPEEFARSRIYGGNLLEGLMSSESVRPEFVVKGGEGKTSGAGGMQRSVVGDKTDYSLALDGVMFRRWAEHLTRATRPPANYAKRNWLLALNGTPEERQDARDRARESAVRHFIQWYLGNHDEDHAAAVFFNVNVDETLKEWK